MKILFALLVFCFVCFLGFFCAWIGGVQAFTKDAGYWASLTILVALCAGGILLETLYRN